MPNTGKLRGVLPKVIIPESKNKETHSKPIKRDVFTAGYFSAAGRYNLIIDEQRWVKLNQWRIITREGLSRVAFDTPYFLTQGLPVDAEYFCRPAFVAFHICQDISYIFCFDLRQTLFKTCLAKG